MCGKHWLVTPEEDCNLPHCGCFGHDTSANNPFRPCEPCGLIHSGMGDRPLVTLRVEDIEQIEPPIEPT